MREPGPDGGGHHVDPIARSILSKKLPAGLDAPVLDEKVARAASMGDLSSARTSAEAPVETAAAAGCPTTALRTDMHEPLADNVGTAIVIAIATRVIRAEVLARAHSDAALGRLSRISAEPAAPRPHFLAEVR